MWLSGMQARPRCEVNVPCRGRPPPISTCSPLGTFTCSILALRQSLESRCRDSTCFRSAAGGPETNVITKRPGEQYFQNHITASGFEEQLTCSKAEKHGFLAVF